jgi:choline dehydrogenase-like flavoprotein
MLPILLCSIASSVSLQAGCRKIPKRADYVICGVGTAGAVLAKKLSDDRTSSVVALHSGDNLNQDPDIKYSKNAVTTVVSALLGPPFFEQGLTVPQPNADNRELLWVRALPEGGASAVNAGAYCRNSNQFAAKWEALAGPLWSPNRLLAIYKELENYHGVTDNRKARGYHGPIDVRQILRPSKVAKVFTRALIQATGIPFVLDYNNPNTPIGVTSKLQYSQKGLNGYLRVSSATAFLNRRVMTPTGFGVNKRKLRVLFDSIALRTVWNGNEAIGVEYQHNGKNRVVYANKGVIVCGGIYSSSFLLQSGVGPQSLLQSLNIPVVYNNPNVGQNLLDQPHVVALLSFNPDDAPKFNQNTPFAGISWLPAPGGDPTSRQVRISTITPVTPEPNVTVSIVDLLQPQSRGSVTINTNDPLAQPILNLGELTNSNDLDLFVSAFQVYMKAFDQQLRAIDDRYGLVYPDPAILDDAALVADFIRENIDSNMHFQGHCKMADENQGGVVNSRGAVHGVRGLYVADNSVCPLPGDGSPMATAYLVAANIAELLLEQPNDVVSHIKK